MKNDRLQRAARCHALPKADRLAETIRQIRPFDKRMFGEFARAFRFSTHRTGTMSSLGNVKILNKLLAVLGLIGLIAGGCLW